MQKKKIISSTCSEVRDAFTNHPVTWHDVGAVRFRRNQRLNADLVLATGFEIQFELHLRVTVHHEVPAAVGALHGNHQPTIRSKGILAASH